MNILYICEEYPPGPHGGIGTSVRLLARQMVKIGHRVVVAGLYSPGYGGTDEFDDEGVRVYRYRWKTDKLLAHEFKLSTRIIKSLLKISGILNLDIKNSLKSYQQKLEGIITRYDIDIVEMPDYNDYVRHCISFIPFPALSVPVVIKMNGSITYFNREAGSTVHSRVFKMEQANINQAAAVAAVSRYTANKSKSYFAYPDEIKVIPNGIVTDIPLSSIEKQNQQVIFTGTLVEKKGVFQLAAAWNMVNKQMPDARLLFLGKGNHRKILDLLSENARAMITFMGHVDVEELYRQLAGSVIAIFPSYAEAFALAPLEAMACGTAVINSSRTSGPELINNNVDGLLIDPDNVEEIASAILHLLNNPEIRNNIARAGREKVRTMFDIASIAQQNVDFYQHVLSHKSDNIIQ